MKKNSTGSNQRQAKLTLSQVKQRANREKLTIGLDLGDRTTHYCILNEEGEILIQDKEPTSKEGLNRVLEKMAKCRVVMEVGTHSPWISRHVAKLGHEVIVANARKVGLIKDSGKKNDRVDAEKLARLGRVDPQLLSPIRHRSEQAQRELSEIRIRAVLVENRTSLINAARGVMKGLGERLQRCDADQVGPELALGLPEKLKELVTPLLEAVAQLTALIKTYEKRIEQVAEDYPEIELLTAIYGVGQLTALTFVLTLEEQDRFKRSREVGPYVGLVPGQSQSGERDPQLRITKQGDRLLRWMLVECAHTIMRHGAADSDLRRWGLAKLKEHQQECQRKGVKKGVKGKKRVLVAIARKLAVLMHHLWATGEVYDPLYGAKRQAPTHSGQKAA